MPNSTNADVIRGKAARKQAAEESRDGDKRWLAIVYPPDMGPVEFVITKHPFGSANAIPHGVYRYAYEHGTEIGPLWGRTRCTDNGAYREHGGFVTERQQKLVWKYLVWLSGFILHLCVFHYQDNRRNAQRLYDEIKSADGDPEDKAGNAPVLSK